MGCKHTGLVEDIFASMGEKEWPSGLSVSEDVAFARYEGRKGGCGCLLFAVLLIPMMAIVADTGNRSQNFFCKLRII
jgi:hypothetical protein